MVNMALVVILFVLVMCKVVFGNAAELPNPCKLFTIHLLRKNGEPVGVNITLPKTCVEMRQLNLLTVEKKSSATSGTTTAVCQVVPLDKTFFASSPKCQLTVDDKGLTVTKTYDGSKPTRGILVFTANFINFGTITTEVPMSGFLPTGTFITTTPPARDQSKTSTASKRDSEIDSFISGPEGPETDVTQSASQWFTKFVSKLTEDTTSGLKQGEDKGDVEDGNKNNDDNNKGATTISFLQTPAFSVIMIVVFVAVIVLLVILLLRQRGVGLPTMRRNRRSVNVPENYEHPNSHHYDRHVPQQQPSAFHAQRALNPDANRESVLDTEYSVIDEGPGDKSSASSASLNEEHGL